MCLERLNERSAMNTSPTIAFFFSLSPSNRQATEVAEERPTAVIKEPEVLESEAPKGKASSASLYHVVAA